MSDKISLVYRQYLKLNLFNSLAVILVVERARFLEFCTYVCMYVYMYVCTYA